MTKTEFQALAGYEVSDHDYYEIIEPMYMAIKSDKADFVRMIDRRRFALRTERQILAELRKIARHLRETCEHYTDFDAKERFEDVLREYRDRVCYAYVQSGYTYEEIQRGCTYPKTLVREDGREVELV